MSEDEDPYAVSSDSDDENKKKPPPKIQIEGRSAEGFKQIKESLTAEQKGPIKDEKTREEIEELRKAAGQSISQMRKDFETGKSSLKNEDDDEGKAEKPAGLDKQTLSSFKDRFEKAESSLEKKPNNSGERNVEGVGRDALSTMKHLFETAPSAESIATEQREEIGSLKRSEAERKKVLAAFMEEEAKEPQKDCHICGKIVYNVERVVAAKKAYHNVCFKCCKCSKKLTPTTYNSHEGELYCRAHYTEALHPERVGALANPDDSDEFEKDDEEFAVVSKPKQLAADVARATEQTPISDELAQIRSLKEKKAELERTAAAAEAGAQKTSAAEEIAAGKVKANLEKIAAGGERDEEEESAEDAHRRELEAIKESVSSVKNKWKTGAVEGATAADTDSTAKEELEALRKGGRVGERWGQANDGHEVVRAYDRSELDTSGAAEARRSFLEGAFPSAPVEKSATDLAEIQRGTLSAFKDRFERGDAAGDHARTAIELDVELKSIKESLGKLTDETNMTPEERADKKKKEIEEEFLRYKIARKLQEKKAREEADGQENGAEAERPTSGIDVEIKMAGKAREKFKEIESQGAQPVFPGKNEPRTSKWDKKEESTAEVVNRRSVEDQQSDEEDADAFDVRNLMNKFKNLANAPTQRAEKHLDELEALRLEARSIREQFEKQSGEASELSDERRRQLEEEFRVLKEERERAHQQLEAERAEAAAEAAANAGDDDVQIAADHASKMAAKWEKITVKEAKKAEKSKMPQRS